MSSVPYMISSRRALDEAYSATFSHPTPGPLSLLSRFGKTVSMADFLQDLAQPFTLLFLVTLVLLIRRLRDARGKRRWGTLCAFGLLYVTCTPGFGWLAVASLEKQVAPYDGSADTDGVIVVLGGGLISSPQSKTGVAPTAETICRCRIAANEYHRANRIVVATGGPGPFAELDASEASEMQRLLIEMGVDPDQILLDEAARDTYENARNSKRLLEPRGITQVTLATHAVHMPRAVACFKAQQFEVRPAPCRYFTHSAIWPLRYILPTVAGASQTAVATHEWLGMLWYRLSGKI